MFELELLCTRKEGMLLSMKLYAILRWRLLTFYQYLLFPNYRDDGYSCGKG